MFDLQLERIVRWIQDNGYGTVSLQFPEGLRQYALHVSDVILSETNAEPIIVGDPCYGACDIRKDPADALIHFGHSRIPSMGDDKDILYIEARSDSVITHEDISGMLPKLSDPVGLAATIQYMDLIPKVKELLERNGLNVYVSQGDDRIAYPGQVLGCNCSAVTALPDDVQTVLYLGEGDFHPLAASLGSDRRIIVFNPVTKDVRDIFDLRERMMRRRFAIIESSKDKERFMVVVCSKTGQRRDDVADASVRKIRAAGKKAYVMVLNEITPERLAYYDIDVLVNTACPRIAMDDSVRYGKPMITATELDIVLGLKDWNEYVFDSI